MKSSMGEDLYNSLNDFLPCFYRFINPVIHQMNSPEGPLNENQLKVLMAAEKTGEISPGDISKLFMIPKTSLTTIIRSLQDRDLIVRKSSAEDGRTFFIGLSEKGQSLIRKKREEDARALESVFSGLDKEKSQDIIRGFRAVKAFFEERGFTL